MTDNPADAMSYILNDRAILQAPWANYNTDAKRKFLSDYTDIHFVDDGSIHHINNEWHIDFLSDEAKAALDYITFNFAYLDKPWANYTPEERHIFLNDKAYYELRFHDGSRIKRINGKWQLWFGDGSEAKAAIAESKAPRQFKFKAGDRVRRTKAPRIGYEFTISYTDGNLIYEDGNTYNHLAENLEHVPLHQQSPTAADALKPAAMRSEWPGDKSAAIRDLAKALSPDRHIMNALEAERQAIAAVIGKIVIDPKFKVGDWVKTDGGEPFQIDHIASRDGYRGSPFAYHKDGRNWSVASLHHVKPSDLSPRQKLIKVFDGWRKHPHSESAIDMLIKEFDDFIRVTTR